jgi:PAS domain S-box-containing protein
VSNELPRLQETLDALPVAIYLTDSEGRLVYFNPAAAKFSGRTPDLGSDYWCVSWKLFWPDGTPMPHDECPMAVALRGGPVLDGVEAIAERPDGARVWFTPYPRVLRDERGTIVAGVNMLLDITERKLAERDHGLLAAIVDSTDDAIISKNVAGMITSWNQGAQRIFGYAAAEAIGQNITLIIPPSRLAEEAAILEQLRRGQRVNNFETVRLRKDGATLDVSLTISPVLDSAGRIVGASKIARDITDRKRADQLLRKNEEQLRILAQALEIQVSFRTQELQRRNQEIVEQSQQLQELSQRLFRTQDEERRRIARELHDSAGQLIAALSMGLAQINNAGGENLEVVRLVKYSESLVHQVDKEIRTMSYLLHPPLLEEYGLCRAIQWYLEGLRDRSGLDIALHGAENLGRLSIDLELAIFRILQECLTNIHRHSQSKAATIRILRDGEVVTIEVEDYGRGIPAEKLAAILSHRSGVGMAAIRERLRPFEGSLNIRSGENGTTVSVIFPRAVRQ